VYVLPLVGKRGCNHFLSRSPRRLSDGTLAPLSRIQQPFQSAAVIERESVGERSEPPPPWRQLAETPDLMVGGPAGVALCRPLVKCAALPTRGASGPWYFCGRNIVPQAFITAFGDVLRIVELPEILAGPG